MRHLLHLLLAGLFALGAASTGCAADATSGASPTAGAREVQTVTVTGKIVHVDLEGGFWGLVAEDGTHYDPVDLPKAYHRDGLRVRATLRTKPGMVHFHMWGTLVDVVKIERLD